MKIEVGKEYLYKRTLSSAHKKTEAKDLVKVIEKVDGVTSTIQFHSGKVLDIENSYLHEIKVGSSEEEEGEGMKIEVGKEYMVLDNYLGFRKGECVKIVDEAVEDKDLLCTLVDGERNVRVFKKDFEKMDIKEIEHPFKPAHYDSAIDTIAFAKVNFPTEQVKGFLRISAIDCLQQSGSESLDNLNEAMKYIQELIEMEEG